MCDIEPCPLGVAPSPWQPLSPLSPTSTIWYELHAREWPFKTQPAEAIIWQVGRGMKPNLSQIGMGKEISVRAVGQADPCMCAWRGDVPWEMLCATWDSQAKNIKGFLWRGLVPLPLRPLACQPFTRTWGWGSLHGVWGGYGVHG